MIKNNENEILEEIVLETHDYENIENISEKNKILQEKIKNLEDELQKYKLCIVNNKLSFEELKTKILKSESKLNEETKKTEYLSKKIFNETADKYNFLKNRLKINNIQFNKDIIIARYSYHEIYNKNWLFTILILIFSSLISFVEAIRLIIEKYELNNILFISTGFNILSLFIGLLITICSGYVKFNDYQKKLETLSSRLSQLILYKKRFDLIHFNLDILYNITKKENEENILDDEKIKDMILEISKIEEEVQNNELLKYISEETHIKYYEKHLDIILKNNIHYNYINGINKILEYDDTLINSKNDVKNKKYTTIMEDELKDEDFKRNLLNTFDEIIKKYKQQNTLINKIKGYLGYNNSNEIIMNDKVQKKIKTFFYNNRYT
jgi:hypothetical protein